MAPVFVPRFPAPVRLHMFHSEIHMYAYAPPGRNKGQLEEEVRNNGTSVGTSFLCGSSITDTDYNHRHLKFGSRLERAENVPTFTIIRPDGVRFSATMLNHDLLSKHFIHWITAVHVLCVAVHEKACD